MGRPLVEVNEETGRPIAKTPEAKRPLPEWRPKQPEATAETLRTPEQSRFERAPQPAVDTRVQAQRVFERDSNISGLEGKVAGLKLRMEAYEKSQSDLHIKQWTEDQLIEAQRALEAAKAA